MDILSFYKESYKLQQIMLSADTLFWDIPTFFLYFNDEADDDFQFKV
jgi:hypothetical protein